jgi:hypothetical protein
MPPTDKCRLAKLVINHGPVSAPERPLSKSLALGWFRIFRRRPFSHAPEERIVAVRADDADEQPPVCDHLVYLWSMDGDALPSSAPVRAAAEPELSNRSLSTRFLVRYE